MSYSTRAHDDAPDDHAPAQRKSHKVLADDRKTFANRTCPPGPEGSTRFKAIKTAYNEVIKHKISRNQEVGFCLLALPVGQKTKG